MLKNRSIGTSLDEFKKQHPNSVHILELPPKTQQIIYDLKNTNDTYKYSVYFFDYTHLIEVLTKNNLMAKEIEEELFPYMFGQQNENIT